MQRCTRKGTENHKYKCTTEFINNFNNIYITFQNKIILIQYINTAKPFSGTNLTGFDNKMRHRISNLSK